LSCGYSVPRSSQVSGSQSIGVSPEYVAASAPSGCEGGELERGKRKEMKAKMAEMK
jgi:hypothetical protein